MIKERLMGISTDSETGYNRNPFMVGYVNPESLNNSDEFFIIKNSVAVRILDNSLHNKVIVGGIKERETCTYVKKSRILQVFDLSDETISLYERKIKSTKERQKELNNNE